MNRTYSWMLLPVFAIAGCLEGDSPTQTDLSRPQSVNDHKAEVVNFCGDCHAYPPADTFPKGLWEDEVHRGFKFYTDSGRSDLNVPAFATVFDYYDQHAPENLELQIPSPDVNTSSVRFRTQAIANPQPGTNVAVADLLFADQHLLACDMKHGNVWKLDPVHPDAKPELVSVEKHPGHVEFYTDAADHRSGMLVADLGSFDPGDHSNGRIVWLNGDKRVVLDDELPRVADAKFADFNGDGRNDVVVAGFGWRKTGRLLLLEQIESEAKTLTATSFQERVLDARHGCSHVFVLDLDGDRDLDLLALFSQEHETIDAFLNDGNGNFEKQNVFAADRPDYGCSCIQLTDLDSDGDPDILFSNGDSMDSHLLKPHHSIQWLENKGNLSFQHHHVDYYPGAYGVAAADFDADGDQDIAAVSMTWWHDVPFNSVVWFEQGDDREFTRHNLDFSTAQHATLEVGDFDNDGDPDIAVGEFEPRPVASRDLLTILWNDGVSDSQ